MALHAALRLRLAFGFALTGSNPTHDSTGTLPPVAFSIATALSIWGRCRPTTYLERRAWGMSVFAARTVWVVPVDSSHSFSVMQTKLTRTSTAVKLDLPVSPSTLVLMSGIQEDLREIIQNNVRRFRVEARMTQQQLAEAADVSVDAIRKWEGKRGVPDRESVTKLAAALGRKMDDFNLENPPAAVPVRQPAFVLNVSGDTPEDLRRLALDYIERMNQEAKARTVEYPPGVRRARGATDPLTTIRAAGDVRREDRPAPPATKAAHASGQKRQRR